LPVPQENNNVVEPRGGPVPVAPTPLEPLRQMGGQVEMPVPPLRLPPPLINQAEQAPRLPPVAP
jgi:hypothetical protein